MTAIETAALTKRYGNTLAVNELSFSIPSGVVYGFLGPNGAGKTTTMRMLTGLLEPTSGTGRVGGVPITDRDGLREQLGYLPEEPPLYDEATGREQLTYIAGLRDLPERESQERIEELLGVLDLTADADTRIAEYSKGMRQKVAYIQAVLHEPPVVFLDEPTSGLDPRAARTLREEILGLAARGTTVFLSTHILPVVEEVADTVGILYEGELVAEDSPESLTGVETDGDESLEDVFLELTDADEVAMDG
ncbi:ABC transporter ATP-binding protein [Halocatena halophila]|uniref:ABC transporter ATP-binding protein n=1 Tax=Halocatena halophila TaxID=2814576 RepID=UPI002ED40F82